MYSITRNPIKDLKKKREERKVEKRAKREEKLMKQLLQQKAEEKQAAAAKSKIEEEEKQKKEKGRPYTVSLALPGSILDNAQTPELRTYLAGQIARAAVVFNIDEIIIFDETGSASGSTEGDYQGIGKHGNCNVQMSRILQYLECPQYLRKSFFPQHKDLQYAGLLNPLDCAHHTRADASVRYREGVVLDVPARNGSKSAKVDVGLRKPVEVDRALMPGVRVTVDMGTSDYTRPGAPSRRRGSLVSPQSPRLQLGLYWGYSVRLAQSLGAVLAEASPPYDLTIGTSEHGNDIEQLELTQFKRLLVVFGGLKGLEASLEADEQLQIEEPSLLFHHYVNACPGQGSHTIRTEEAILITLSALRPKIMASTQKQN